MTSRAEQLFKFIVEPEADNERIDRLFHVARTVNEWEFLDFKGAYNALEESGKKSAFQNWAELLSAFANCGGGLVVWGLDVRSVNGVNTFNEERDVSSPNAEKLAELLKEWLAVATDEPITGTQIETLNRENSDGGYVVCLIPEGNRKPYRACGRNLERYLMRVGDKTKVIPHSMLRSLFYPSSTTKLLLSWKCKYENNSYDWTASLINEGELSADRLVVTYGKILGRFGQSNVRPWKVLYTSAESTAYVTDTPLHPGFGLEVPSIRIQQNPHEFIGSTICELVLSFHYQNGQSLYAKISLNGNHFLCEARDEVIPTIDYPISE